MEENGASLDKFLQQPVPDANHELRQSLVFAKSMLERLTADNEDLHNRLQLVNEMDELGNGGPLQGATSMAVSFGGRIVPDIGRNDQGPKDQLFGVMSDSDQLTGNNQNIRGGIKNKNKSSNNNNNNQQVDPEAQRILSKKKSKHDRFFSTYNLLSREINNADQMIQQLGTFESIVRYHKSAMTYNSIVDNLSMQFKTTQDSLTDANDQLKQYQNEISESLDSTNIDFYKNIIETTIKQVLQEGRKWLDCIDQIKDEFSGAKALVHPDHQKVANYEIKLRELQSSLPVEATAKLAALGVLPEFVKKALDDEDFEEEEKQKKKSKQKSKKKKGGSKKGHHDKQRTLLINDEFDVFEEDDPSDFDDDGYSADDAFGADADDEAEYEDPNVVAYQEVLATANIIKNTILQKIDTAKQFIEMDALKLQKEDSETGANNNNNNSNNSNNNNISSDDRDNLGIPNADGDEDLNYDGTPEVWNPMKKFDESIDDTIANVTSSFGVSVPGKQDKQYTSLVDNIEDELKQFADILVRAGEYVHPSQRALIFACKEIVKQRTDNNKLRRRIDHIDGELLEARATLDAKQTELDKIHTEARTNGGVLKVYAQASDAVINGVKDDDLKEVEMTWLPEFADSMRTINRQCNELDNLLVVSEDYEDSDYVVKTVRKNIDNEKVVQTITAMKDSVREFCRVVMKVYHLVPPHIKYVRALENEYQYTKGYCRTKFSELTDKKDEIFYRDNIIREKDIMIEELENRLARIMTSASASAETRMEALMGMDMKIQSYNKIMDAVSEEMEKRNNDLNNLEDKSKRHLDSSSFRKVKKFIKELHNKNDKSKDIMRNEMNNARLYVHGDRIMVDKLQAQVIKLKNELNLLHTRIENGEFDPLSDENIGGIGIGIGMKMGVHQNGIGKNGGNNNNNQYGNNNSNKNNSNINNQNNSNNRIEEEPEMNQQRSIKFGGNVKGADGSTSSKQKKTKHRSGKSVHDIAFRQHMLEMDEEIEKLKESTNTSGDVSRLNAKVNELTEKNEKLTSEIAHLRRTVDVYQSRDENLLYDESSNANNTQGNNQSQMQEEIYNLRREKQELQDIIEAQRIAQTQDGNGQALGNYETPGGPNSNINNGGFSQVNQSNSLLYDGHDVGGGMNDSFETPGGIDSINGATTTTAIGGTMHDPDDIINPNNMTTTGGGGDAFMYQTPQGPADAAAVAMGIQAAEAQAADYEEDSLVLLTKQLQKQNQYIMELTTKIKRLEVDFVKDKQKLLESTCKEIDHLRNIIKDCNAKR